MSDQQTISEAVGSASTLAVIGWKVLGGLAAFGAIGAGLAAIIVMCATRPRDGREWTIALISTFVCSIGGGATAVMYLNLQHWAFSPIGLVALGFLIFACGLPGWALVRWIFNYINKHSNDTVVDVAKDMSAGAATIKKDLMP